MAPVRCGVAMIWTGNPIISHASSGNRVRVTLSVSQRACIHEFPTDLNESEYGGNFMEEFGRSFSEGKASTTMGTDGRLHCAAGFSSCVRTQPLLEFPRCCAGVGAE